jgi:hypothetical protein
LRLEFPGAPQSPNAAPNGSPGHAVERHRLSLAVAGIAERFYDCIYFQNHFWKRIMPAIVTATVIRWKVEEEESEEEARTVYDDEKQVSTYVGDATGSSLEVMIIGQYILDEAEDDEDELVELLKAARDGLLQVTQIKTQEVNPPPAPPRRPAEKKLRRPRGRPKLERGDKAAEPDAGKGA